MSDLTLYAVCNKTKDEVMLIETDNKFNDCITDLFNNINDYYRFMDEREWQDDDEIYVCLAPTWVNRETHHIERW